MSDAWPGTALTAAPSPQDDAPTFPGEAVATSAETVTDPNTGTTAPSVDPETGEVFRSWTISPSGQTIPAYGPQGQEAPTPPEPSMLEQAGTGLGQGTRGAMHGVAAFADLLGLPVAAVARMLGADIQPLTNLADKASDAMGLPQIGGVPQAIYDGAIGGLGTAGVGSALAAAPGVAGAVGQILAATPIAGAVSNATGSASGEMAREAGAGPAGQLAASLAGGGLGAAGAVGIPAAARRATQSTVPNEILAAFQRQQVAPMADQVGGPVSRMASGVSRMTLGGVPLSEAAERSIASARAARDRIAGLMGRITDDTGAGQAAQRGARKAIDATAEQASKLYDAIPINPKRNTVLTNTRAALGDLTAGMESNPDLSKMIAENGRLKGYLDALTPKTKYVDKMLPGGGKAQPVATKTGGQLSWEDLKRFRSIVGEIAGQPTLAEDTSQTAMRKLYAGLSEDMRATAAADGPKSLAKFERANTYFRARQARIDDTLASILGDDFKKSPEDAFKQIERWSKQGGDSARIARLMRSLPEDEVATVRATLFSKMGDAPAGRQDMTGTVFSPAEYATQWMKLDHRAKSVMFPSADYRSDLDDIARIADAMKRSNEFANTSRTALAGNGIGLATMALAGSPLSAGGIAATQFGVGKLLASPRFARWLASAPRKPIGPATLAHINRLTAIAAAEPTIANEVLHLQERLASAFTPVKAAASGPVVSEKPQDAGQVPPQKQQQGNEADYRSWLQRYGIREDPTYDTKAAFRAGLTPDARGHLNDQFKLPNHPTFSDESIHNGEGGKQGGKWIQTGGPSAAMPEGTWIFKASDWNLKNMNKAALKAYFDHVEPGSTIQFPDGEKYTGREQ